MRKVFTLLLFTVLATIGVRAEEGNATVSFSSTEDGKVLTITGKGDLSTILEKTTITSYTFNESAEGKVFTTTDNTNYSSVKGNDSYSTNTAYYKALVTPTLINDLLESTIIDSKSTSDSWNCEKLTSQPLYASNANSTGGGNLTYVMKVESDWGIPNEGTYYVYEDENGNWTLGDKKYTALSRQGMIEEGYIISETKFKTKVDIYMSLDGNESNLTTLTAYTEYTYNSSATYYTGEVSYEKYQDTGSWITANNSGFVTTNTTTSNMTFEQMLKAEMKNGSYEKIVFVKADGAESLIITPGIANTLVYPDDSEYQSLKELDLKATTITTFEGAFVLKDNYNNNKTITHPNILRLPSSTQTIIGSGHLDFTSLNGLTLLDISALNLTDEQVGYLPTDNGISKCNVLDKKNLDSERLKERWGAKYFNVFSPKETAEGEPSEINVFVGNISTLDLVGNASGYVNVVVSSYNAGIFGNVKYMKTFMTKVNGVTGIKNLVLAKVATWGSQTYDINDLTNTDVIRIIMPDNQDLEKVTNASHKPILQSYDTNTKKETLLVTNAGDLEKIQNAHYYSTDIDNAYWQEYKGNLNAKDILFLNNIKAKRLNIANANYPEEDSEYKEFISALKNYKNSTIEYLALPKNCLTLEVTDKDNFNYQSNVNLIGVGVLMEEVNAENTVPTLHTYTKYNSDETKKGEIAALIEMMGLSSKTNIKRIVFSGYLDASDIGGYVQGEYSIGIDGHLYHKTIKTKPEAIEENNTGDLYGANPESADFSKAYFTEPFDMCINGSCIATYKEIKLPLTMTEIPENFITGCSNIKELYIPCGYETVGKNALNGCNISHIYTDETKDENGNVYMAGDNGDKSMTLPASLKKICTGAFAISDNVDIYDVYILAEKAPICEMDAFSSAMYFNNNSYNPTTPITAESYQKGGGTSSMSVLHFPTKCNTENVKKYTDPTREYTLADGLATTDANGNLLYWPNQSEFNTAYIQAVTGYTWKSWKIERVTYSTEIGNGLIPSGTSGSDVKRGAQEAADAKFQENGSPADTQYWTASSEEDYRGWHQFVLTSFSKSKNEDPTFNFGYITDNDWWTICLPFDMTKAKLKKVYGEKTKVCTLVNVVRSYNGSDANYPKNSVTLVFGNNLMEKTDDPETLTVNDEDVVIKAGYPYMIKPSLSTEQMTNPKELLVFSDPSYATKLEGKTAAYKILTTEKNIKARKETLNGDVDNYTYKFIGSFVPYYMPQHSYFLGWDTKQNGVAFFYQAEMPSSNIKNWNAYTCVIGVNWDNPTWVEATAKDVSHWETYTVSGDNMISVSKDDSFPSAANGKITNMQFGTGETDAIETVHMGNKTVTFVSGRVYNLNGQVVGENGNIDHLGKGIYVVNGKKFVVK